MVHTLESKIEILDNGSEVLGIIVNISDNVNKAIAFFDLLLTEKANGFLFVDSDIKTKLLCLCENKNLSYAADECFNLTVKEIEVIRNMLLDVLNLQGFKGYHIDLEVYLRNKKTDLSIIMQDRSVYID